MTEQATLPKTAAAPLAGIASDAPDLDRYFPHYRTKKGERGVSEIDEEVSVDRKALVKQIAEGQFENIDAVYCGNEAMTSFRNVTRDIADDVLSFCIDDERALSPELRNWLHTHVGIRLTEDAVAEYPFLDADFGR